MSGKFVPASETVREQLSWGSLGWCCRPAGIGAKDLVVIEVTLAPGGGHAFHRHPKQEETIYVIDGQVEQWLDRQKRVMTSGDCVFLAPGTVHASFNKSDRPAKLLAILGPCVDGANGYQVEEVAGQAPWNTLG